MPRMKEDISKSQAKRDAKALQDLGVNIAQLSASHLDQIPLPEDLLEAIAQFKKNNTNVAKKRNVQLIGRLMRNIEDISPIQAAYDKISSGGELNTARFQLMESWRSRLLSDDKQALTDFLQQYPSDNSQQLRLLIRQARSERDQQKNLGASTALFRWIREHIT
jgi:ribosome-associated protein